MVTLLWKKRDIGAPLTHLVHLLRPSVNILWVSFASPSFSPPELESSARLLTVFAPPEPRRDPPKSSLSRTPTRFSVSKNNCLRMACLRVIAAQNVPGKLSKRDSRFMHNAATHGGSIDHARQILGYRVSYCRCVAHDFGS